MASIRVGDVALESDVACCPSDPKVLRIKLDVALSDVAASEDVPVSGWGLVVTGAVREGERPEAPLLPARALSWED